ncbi:uridine kinase [Yoonia sp.]|uniref:uridine kinase n=1 Tax=Yoonia sp. TaxID=2212373 RepID=UPI00391D73B0
MPDDAVAAIVAEIGKLRGDRDRVLVGIAGAPASGKSTIAADVVNAFRARDGAGSAVLVPMDGYHLDNAELDLMGMRSVKGAPQTFDVAGFVGLVRAIRSQSDVIRYPLFDRAEDKTMPDAGTLYPTTPVVVIEGNYLLLRQKGWQDLRPLFDLTVMLSAPLTELRTRLVDRWISNGFSYAEAKARAEENDIPNAQAVTGNSAAAHLTLRVGVQEKLQER